MLLLSRRSGVALLSSLALVVACSGGTDDPQPGAGGTGASGGSGSSGGASGSGGTTASAGGTTSTTGGTTQTGGAAGSGGQLAGSGGQATGGTTQSGGSAGTAGTGGTGTATPSGYCRSFANGSGTTQPCYVGTDNKAYCINDDGTTTALSMLPGNAVNVTGQNFTTAACAVNDSGAVYCGQYPQLGTGSPVVASGAVQVSGSLNGQCVLTATGITCSGVTVDAPALPAGTPTEIACYYHGCCALNDAGAMYCWGDTTAIGGMADDSVRAVPLPSGKKAIGMGPGQDHLCALLEGGQVQCWGADWNKQLGGLGENKTTGVTLVASGATAVVAGQFHTCVAYEDKHVECVSGGQSEGAGLDLGTLTAVSGVTDAIALSAGKHYTCALTSTGTIQCWGRIGPGDAVITVTGPAAAACE